MLISGRGSNMVAVLDALDAGGWPIDVSAVISNRPEAPGLAVAESRGIHTEMIDHKAFASREAFDDALAHAIEAHAPDLIVLAGFMRILTTPFCEAFAGRLLNIHPSLLPAYKGLDTHARVLADGSRFHGATVHAVTAELDHGPILAQAVVPVLEDDTPSTLAARVLSMEHQLLPMSVIAVLGGLMRLSPAGWVAGSPRPGFESLEFRPWHVHPNLTHSPD